MLSGSNHSKHYCCLVSIATSINVIWFQPHQALWLSSFNHHQHQCYLVPTTSSINVVYFNHHQHQCCLFSVTILGCTKMVPAIYFFGNKKVERHRSIPVQYTHMKTYIFPSLPAWSCLSLNLKFHKVAKVLT